MFVSEPTHSHIVVKHIAMDNYSEDAGIYLLSPDTARQVPLEIDTGFLISTTLSGHHVHFFVQLVVIN